MELGGLVVIGLIFDYEDVVGELVVEEGELDAFVGLVGDFYDLGEEGVE